jgi:hypothetical protein
MLQHKGKNLRCQARHINGLWGSEDCRVSMWTVHANWQAPTGWQRHQQPQLLQMEGCSAFREGQLATTRNNSSRAGSNVQVAVVTGGC